MPRTDGQGWAGRGIRRPRFLAAAFEHRTSRAGDPQLHTHVLVANAIQRPDGQWAALDGRLIYAHAETAGYVHEAALRNALARDLAAQWEGPVNGIADIRGVPQDVLDAFSQRSHEIDAYLRQRGQASAAARQVAAVRTREAKDYGVTPAQLLPEWRDRAARLSLTPQRVQGLLGRARAEMRSPLHDERLITRLAGRDGLTRSASHSIVASGSRRSPSSRARVRRSQRSRKWRIGSWRPSTRFRSPLAPTATAPR
ncbi:MobF family relaxase [Solirubrobacter pauli]|uniref:MobF family relaxase n=1 Tax=Solirubrobacter pauli TaxID=166793 RepID=UPI000EB1150F|nr:MobF family relaxase [Solirubrobacter pauli]